MASLVQMGIELKNLSQNLPEEDPEWKAFCDSVVHQHETKWTKKLEDYNKEEYGEEEVSEEEFKRHEDEENEQIISNVIMNAEDKLNRLKNRTLSAQQEKLEELEKGQQKKNARDDWSVGGSLDNNYVNSNYWKTPDQYSLEELMKEYGN